MATAFLTAALVLEMWGVASLIHLGIRSLIILQNKKIEPLKSHELKLVALCGALASFISLVLTLTAKRSSSLEHLPCGSIAIFLLLGAYLVLRSSVEDPHQRERLSAVYAILGTLSSMFIFIAAPPSAYLPTMGVVTSETQIISGVATAVLYAVGVFLFYRAKQRAA
ncbi:MAG: hypothetical protein ACP5JH_07810 [Bacteroidota bacterium]